MGCQKAKNDFISFCIHSDRHYDPNWHHELLGEALQKVESGEIDRLLITMPPRHGKSEMTTIKFPAWFVGRHPEKSVITASYSGDLAVNFGRKVRNLVDSRPYKDVFQTELAEDSKSAGTWHTKEGGSYNAAGVGGAITGKGAHVFIIDDPYKNREDAESEVWRDTVWNWYSSVVYTRLEEQGAIILIQTRWQEDDLAGRLLREGNDKWVHLNFPAVAEENEKFRKIGDPLWIKKYNKEALERIKQNIGVYDWSALYQQSPTNRESREFKEEWLKYYNEDPSRLNIFMTVDPAISKRDEACNSAIVVCGVDSDYNIYILDYIAKKLNPEELINNIWELAEAWEPDTIGIETIAYQQAVKFYFEKKMQDQMKWFNIVEIKTKVDKNEKIRRLIPFYSNGKVFHKRGSFQLEEELSKFPKGKNVDILDALAMQLEILFVPDKERSEEPENPYINDPTAPFNRNKSSGYKNIYSYK